MPIFGDAGCFAESGFGNGWCYIGIIPFIGDTARVVRRQIGDTGRSLYGWLRRTFNSGDGIADAARILSLDDLASLKGATPGEVRALIPEGWIERPLRKGDGTRFTNPERPGETIMIEMGSGTATDPLHAGPYLRVSRDGTIHRIPLFGNPTLK